MKYIPHTNEEIKEMLKAINIKDIDELFSNIKNDIKFTETPQIPRAHSEPKLLKYLKNLADQNITPLNNAIFFTGAGRYFHYIPAIIPYLTSRSEFSTCYTPYQAEISQGTLQSIYEYQTLICNLFKMDVANASMYDGASSLAEAILMAHRLTDKKTFYISHGIHPYYREVLKTYTNPLELNIMELTLKNGVTELESIEINNDLAAVILQSPNFFGCIEDLRALQKKLENTGIMTILAFTEPIAYGLLKAPGNFNIDIVCGEGQSFGLSPSFGGPSLGIFTTKLSYLRSMPGRVVGKTIDRAGNTAFCLTLSTREQHIRREKATSNICTNENLCALSACIYLAYTGKEGLKKIAKINYDKAHYLEEKFIGIGFKKTFKAQFFNEFVLKAPKGFNKIHKKLQKKGIFAGISLKEFYPELDDHYLFTVTELNSKEDIDFVVTEVQNEL
jgi:glycine dehydrogenase subunit 1